MSRFKTPNGKATVVVGDHQDGEMISRGMILQGNEHARAEAKATANLGKTAKKSKKRDTVKVPESDDTPGE